MKGKELEARVGRSFTGHAGLVHNSNGYPLCDWLLTLSGLPSILIECKECASNNFPISNIKPNERKCLNRHTLGGGLALIVICRKGYGTFAMDWLNWRIMEQRMGYKPTILFPLDDQPRARRANGTASVPLVTCRPLDFVEVPLSRCGRRYEFDFSRFVGRGFDPEFLEPWKELLEEKEL